MEDNTAKRIPFCIIEKMALGVLGLLAALGVLTVGCGELVGNERAVETLKAEGYSDIHINAQHGISPHLVGGCGADDDVAFDATAKNPKGMTTDITVCCGVVIKGCTLRH